MIQNNSRVTRNGNPNNATLAWDGENISKIVDDIKARHLAVMGTPIETKNRTVGFIERGGVVQEQIILHADVTRVGKVMSQNNMTAFMRNEKAYAMDVNFDTRFEQMIKLPNLLNEFNRNPNLGFINMAEYIFTRGYNWKGEAVSIGDETWTTIVQRNLGMVGAIGFYGHNAIMDTKTFQQGGVVPPDYVAEDLMLAIKTWNTGKSSVQREYMRAGKARESSWQNQAVAYEKFGMSSIELLQGRAVYRYFRDSNINIFKKITLFMTLAFYVKKPLIMVMVPLYVGIVLFLGVSGYVAFPMVLALGAVGIYYSQAINIGTLGQFILEKGVVGGLGYMTKVFWNLVFFFTAYIPLYATGHIKGAKGLAKFVVSPKGWALHKFSLVNDALEPYRKQIFISVALVSFVALGGYLWLSWGLIWSLFVIVMVGSFGATPILSPPGMTPWRVGYSQWWEGMKTDFLGAKDANGKRAGGAISIPFKNASPKSIFAWDKWANPDNQNLSPRGNIIKAFVKGIIAGLVVGGVMGLWVGAVAGVVFSWPVAIGFGILTWLTGTAVTTGVMWDVIIPIVNTLFAASLLFTVGVLGIVIKPLHTLVSWSLTPIGIKGHWRERRLADPQSNAVKFAFKQLWLENTDRNLPEDAARVSPARLASEYNLSVGDKILARLNPYLGNSIVQGYLDDGVISFDEAIEFLHYQQTASGFLSSDKIEALQDRRAGSFLIRYADLSGKAAGSSDTFSIGIGFLHEFPAWLSRKFFIKTPATSADRIHQKNFPVKQKYLKFKAAANRYLLAVNPFLVDERHITIPIDETIEGPHQQKLSRDKVLDQITIASKTDSTVVWNGEEAGSSLPYHFHFQSMKVKYPVMSWKKALLNEGVVKSEYALNYPSESLRRPVLFLTSDSLDQLAEEAWSKISALQNANIAHDTVAVRNSDGSVTIAILPVKNEFITDDQIPAGYAEKLKSEHGKILKLGSNQAGGMIPVSNTEDLDVYDESLVEEIVAHMLDENADSILGISLGARLASEVWDPNDIEMDYEIPEMGFNILFESNFETDQHGIRRKTGRVLSDQFKTSATVRVTVTPLNDEVKVLADFDNRTRLLDIPKFLDKNEHGANVGRTLKQWAETEYDNRDEKDPNPLDVELIETWTVDLTDPNGKVQKYWVRMVDGESVEIRLNDSKGEITKFPFESGFTGPLIRGEIDPNNVDPEYRDDLDEIRGSLNDPQSIIERYVYVRDNYEGKNALTSIVPEFLPAEGNATRFASGTGWASDPVEFNHKQSFSGAGIIPATATTPAYLVDVRVITDRIHQGQDNSSISLDPNLIMFDRVLAHLQDNQLDPSQSLGFPKMVLKGTSADVGEFNAETGFHLTAPARFGSKLQEAIEDVNEPNDFINKRNGLERAQLYNRKVGTVQKIVDARTGAVIETDNLDQWLTLDPPSKVFKNGNLYQRPTNRRGLQQNEYQINKREELNPIEGLTHIVGFGGDNPGVYRAFFHRQQSFLKKKKADVGARLSVAQTEHPRNIALIARESGLKGLPKGGGQFDYVRDISRGNARRGHNSSVITPNIPQRGQKAISRDQVSEDDIKTINIRMFDQDYQIEVWRITQDGVDFYLLNDPNGILFTQLYAQPQTDNLVGVVEAVALSQAAAHIQDAFGIKFDILHVNDWQAGFAPAYAREVYQSHFSQAGILFTTHNSAYQGVFNGYLLGDEIFKDASGNETGRNRLFVDGVLNAGVDNRVYNGLVRKLLDLGILKYGENIYERDGQTIIQLIPDEVGAYKRDTNNILNIPWEVLVRTDKGGEYYAEPQFGHKFSAMKLGVVFADGVVPVSEGNAEEILIADEDGGTAHGFDGIFRTKRMLPIFNGTDATPTGNPHLTSDGYTDFSKEDSSEIILKAKDRNKRALFNDLRSRQADADWKEGGAGIGHVLVDGLKGDQITEDQFADSFTIVSVARFAEQKGYQDIDERYLQNLRNLSQELGKDVRLIILGSGATPAEIKIQNRLLELSRQFPDVLSIVVGFDAALADRLYASGDAFLMPSYFEPAGIAQQAANLFGTPVIAALTGGLKDFFGRKSMQSQLVSNRWGGVGYAYEAIYPGQSLEYRQDDALRAIREAAKTYYENRDEWNESVILATQYNASIDDRVKLYESIAYEPVLKTVRQGIISNTNLLTADEKIDVQFRNETTAELESGSYDANSLVLASGTYGWALVPAGQAEAIYVGSANRDYHNTSSYGFFKATRVDGEVLYGAFRSKSPEQGDSLAEEQNYHTPVIDGLLAELRHQKATLNWVKSGSVKPASFEFVGSPESSIRNSLITLPIDLAENNLCCGDVKYDQRFDLASESITNVNQRHFDTSGVIIGSGARLASVRQAVYTGALALASLVPQSFVPGTSVGQQPDNAAAQQDDQGVADIDRTAANIIRAEEKGRFYEVKELEVAQDNLEAIEDLKDATLMTSANDLTARPTKQEEGKEPIIAHDADGRALRASDIPTELDYYLGYVGQESIKINPRLRVSRGVSTYDWWAVTGYRGHLGLNQHYRYFVTYKDRIIRQYFTLEEAKESIAAGMGEEAAAKADAIAPGKITSDNYKVELRKDGVYLYPYVTAVGLTPKNRIESIAVTTGEANPLYVQRFLITREMYLHSKAVANTGLRVVNRDFEFTPSRPLSFWLEAFEKYKDRVGYQALRHKEGSDKSVIQIDISDKKDWSEIAEYPADAPTVNLNSDLESPRNRRVPYNPISNLSDWGTTEQMKKFRDMFGDQVFVTQIEVKDGVEWYYMFDAWAKSGQHFKAAPILDGIYAVTFDKDGSLKSSQRVAFGSAYVPGGGREYKPGVTGDTGTIGSQRAASEIRYNYALEHGGWVGPRVWPRPGQAGEVYINDDAFLDQLIAERSAMEETLKVSFAALDGDDSPRAVKLRNAIVAELHLIAANQAVPTVPYYVIDDGIVIEPKIVRQKELYRAKYDAIVKAINEQGDIDAIEEFYHLYHFNFFKDEKDWPILPYLIIYGRQRTEEFLKDKWLDVIPEDKNLPEAELLNERIPLVLERVEDMRADRKKRRAAGEKNLPILNPARLAVGLSAARLTDAEQAVEAVQSIGTSLTASNSLTTASVSVMVPESKQEEFESAFSGVSVAGVDVSFVTVDADADIEDIFAQTISSGSFDGAVLLDDILNPAEIIQIVGRQAVSASETDTDFTRQLEQISDQGEKLSFVIANLAKLAPIHLKVRQFFANEINPETGNTREGEVMLTDAAKVLAGPQHVILTAKAYARQKDSLDVQIRMIQEQQTQDAQLNIALALTEAQERSLRLEGADLEAYDVFRIAEGQVDAAELLAASGYQKADNSNTVFVGAFDEVSEVTDTTQSHKIIAIRAKENAGLAVKAAVEYLPRNLNDFTDGLLSILGLARVKGSNILLYIGIKPVNFDAWLKKTLLQKTADIMA
ncbi:MAG: glycogen/starch synthase [Candidatus Omnitrophica bacterium]|nr:glycogen/starch synthase [Candidatus Omnitrophota bacterium]